MNTHFTEQLQVIILGAAVVSLIKLFRCNSKNKTFFQNKTGGVFFRVTDFPKEAKS